MGDISSDENQVKILLEEYKIFREEILQNISTYQKSIYIFSSIILILFGYGFKEGFNLNFVILPFVIVAWHLLTIEGYKWLHRLASYNQVIEEKINGLLDIDYKIMYWEHLSEDWSQGKRSYQLSHIILIYLPIILIYGCSAHKGACVMDTCCHCDCIPMYNVFIVIYISLFIFCIVAVYNIFRSNEKNLRTIKIKMNL